MSDSKPTEADWQAARRVKKANEDRLLALPGVVGVDVGFKVVDGQKTDVVAIRIHVEKKTAPRPDEVGDENAIPTEIEGIPTDVLENRYRLH